MTALEQELVAKYGEAERARIARGLTQVSKFWRQDAVGDAGKADGDAAALAAFVRDNYAGNAAARDALFSRMEFAFESLDGHLHEIGRDFRRQSDLDLGPIHAFDETLAAYDPGAHVSDDLFDNKLAFVILLNFPLTSLDERLQHGDGLDAPRVGGNAAGGEVLEADPGGGEARQREGVFRCRALHRRIQHLDAPRRGFPRDAPLSTEAAPLVALESSRPDQGRL